MAVLGELEKDKQDAGRMYSDNKLLQRSTENVQGGTIRKESWSMKVVRSAGEGIGNEVGLHRNEHIAMI